MSIAQSRGGMACQFTKCIAGPVAKPRMAVDSTPAINESTLLSGDEDGQL
jgi:hypothetical protein